MIRSSNYIETMVPVAVPSVQQTNSAVMLWKKYGMRAYVGCYGLVSLGSSLWPTVSVQSASPM
jgi:hypothetical protein